MLNTCIFIYVYIHNDFIKKLDMTGKQYLNSFIIKLIYCREIRDIN